LEIYLILRSKRFGGKSLNGGDCYDFRLKGDIATMKALELRTYTRAELEEIFKTSRTDSMKRSLSRAGYKFECSGRGSKYTLTITALPTKSEFEIFAIKELGYGERTFFEVLEQYLYLLFYDLEYRYCSSDYQAQVLKEKYNLDISGQTLLNWKKHLREKNFIMDADEKYCLCRSGEKPTEIPAEEYKKIIEELRQKIKDGEDETSARTDIYYKYGGMPMIRKGFQENLFEKEKLDRLHEILEEFARNQSNSHKFR